MRAIAATPGRYYEFDQHDAREQADHDADRRRYAGGDIFEYQAQAFAAGMGCERAGKGDEQYEEELVGHRSHLRVAMTQQINGKKFCVINSLTIIAGRRAVARCVRIRSLGGLCVEPKRSEPDRLSVGD
jgi:hypothetical protein